MQTQASKIEANFETASKKPSKSNAKSMAPTQDPFLILIKGWEKRWPVREGLQQNKDLQPSLLNFLRRIFESCQKRNFQLLNDVEFGSLVSGLGLFPHLVEDSFLSKEKYEKGLLRSLSVQDRGAPLPLKNNLKEFLNTANLSGKVRIEKSSPTCLFAFPWLPESEMIGAVVQFSNWFCPVLKVKSDYELSDLSREQFAVSYTIAGEFLRIVGHFLPLKLTPMEELEALRARERGGLLCLVKSLIPEPTQISEFCLRHEHGLEAETLPVFSMQWPSQTQLNLSRPQQKIANAAEVTATLVTLSGDFCSPSFLFGAPQAKLPVPGNVQLHKNMIASDGLMAQQTLTVAGSFGVIASHEIVSHWFPITAPLLTARTRSDSLDQYEHVFKMSLQTVHKNQVIESNVKWKTKDGACVETLSQGFASYVEHLLNQAGQTASAPIIHSFASSLVLVPEFSFTIDNEIASEEDFASAVLLGNGNYQLPSQTVVSGALYQKTLALYLTRKRSFARLGEIGISSLFRTLPSLTEGADQLLGQISFQSVLKSFLDPTILANDRVKIQAAQKLILSKQPCAPHAKLWDYQAYAVAWILGRFSQGLGACLADEMGLGKTLMTIATLKTLKSGLKSPALVLCPKSLVLNWQSELTKFAPDLIVTEFAGVDGHGYSEENKSAHVVLCGYHRYRTWWKRQATAERKKPGEKLTKAGHGFSQLSTSLLVLDEAHQLKNADTQLSEAVHEIQTPHRLALTGTPLENHVGELWNLINLLNPGYLGTRSSFEVYVARARAEKEAEVRTLLLTPLRELLSFAMLRRTKKCAEVQIDLPEKIVQKMVHGLTEEQSAAYKAVIDMAQDAALLAKSTFGVRAIFLKALTHLKQICIHPEVFFSGEEDDYVFGTAERAAEYAQVDLRLHDHLLKVAQKFKVKGDAKDSVQALISRSDKFAQLFEILEDAKETDKGILIFTQFRAAAQLVRRMLAASKTPGWEDIPVLDGQLSAQQRMAMVDQFQKNANIRELALSDPNYAGQVSEACPILILSLKAGGVGLNLTGASRVLHLDRWWNPAVEDQATDRAHRLGQKSTVFVNMLIASGTIEQSLDVILAEKRLLAEDILSANENSVLSRDTASVEGFARLVDPLGYFIKRSH